MKDDKKIRICYFGFYDPDLSRNGNYIKGLKQNNAKVIECCDCSRGLIKYYKLFIKHWKIRNKYDVMIVGYAGHVITLFAKLISKKPVILNALASLYEARIVSRRKYAKHSLGAWRTLLIDWLAFKFADLSLFESNKEKEFIVKKFSINPRKCVGLYTGADDAIFYPNANIKKANKFTVLFRGRFLPEAGVKHILEAAKILEKEEINFLIIGFGLLEKEIKEQIKKLKLKNLKLISRYIKPEKLREKMLPAHISIGQIENHERLKTTVPYKVFESLALKLPYITGNSLGIGELLEDRKNCLMVNLADPQDLADKIMELKNSSELRKKIAENGYKLYKEKLTPKVLGKELLNIIRTKLYSS